MEDSPWEVIFNLNNGCQKEIHQNFKNQRRKIKRNSKKKMFFSQFYWRREKEKREKINTVFDVTL